jgi:hypothetical protein
MTSKSGVALIASSGSGVQGSGVQEFRVPGFRVSGVHGFTGFIVAGLSMNLMNLMNPLNPGTLNP